MEGQPIHVFGAGAIGSAVAARLAASGVAATLVARGARRDAIARDGLICHDRDGCFQATPRVIDSLAGEKPAIVLLAVKAQALSGALDAIVPHLAPDSLLVTLVNGIPWWLFLDRPPPRAPIDAVDPGGRLAAMLPAHALVGSVVYTTAMLQKDGSVRVTSPHRLELGAVAAAGDPRIADYAAIFSAAGIATTVTQSIRDAVWTKVALNLATNPLSVVTGATLEQMFTEPALLSLVTDMLDEAWLVASRYDARPTMSRSAMIERGRQAGAFRTSMLEDHLAGRPLELASIVDAVEELGARVGIALPWSAAVAALARFRAANRPAKLPETL